MTIRYTRRALAQLAAVLAYIDERSPSGAQNIKARLKAVIDLAAEHPRIGRLTDRPGIRRVVVTPYPYFIFYKAADTGVVIHGIRHAARDPRRRQKRS